VTILATELVGATWRKSTFSGPNGGDCVEVAALAGVPWRKSTHSGPNGGECVEVALAADTTGVRDSKNPDGPALVFTGPTWRGFLSRLA
jgi:hypothetical protein